MMLMGRNPLVWGFCVGPSLWAPFVSRLWWKTTGVNHTLCAPRRPAFLDVCLSLSISPVPMRFAIVETTQPQPTSLWCRVYVWALHGGLHLSTACGAK
jgi:hypothetical protein